MKPSHRAGLHWMACAVLLAACRADEAGQATADVPRAERYGGTAVVAAAGDLQSMNALASNETYSLLFQQSVLFMPLLRYDEHLEPVPWLAERWDTTRVAGDSLDLTFHLRRDVKWQDGVPTTADDVLFTYARVRDPEVDSSLGGGFALYSPRAVRVDDHTVRFRLRSHAEFLDGWTQLAIMPEHVLGRVPADRLATDPFGSERPVGNGPFRFARRVPDQEWVFDANPDFPKALGGRPYLDRLVFRAIPSYTTLVAETLGGSVDVYLRASPEVADQLESSPSAELLSSSAPSWTFIAWNGRLPQFDTPEERRALTLALDREQIARSLWGGHARAGRSVVPPSHWAFAPDSPSVALPHDPAAARRLLAQAGWRDRNGDGILEDAQGRPFRFVLKVPAGNQNLLDLAQIVQAQLRKVGVDARPAGVEGNTLISQIVGQPDGHGGRDRDFEAVAMAWDEALRKDDSQLFHSRNLDGPFQLASFSDPRVDSLLDSLSLVVDRARARPLWLEYQALLAREAPFTVVYYEDLLTGVNRRLHGVTVDTRGELASVARWWIAPGDRRPTRAP